MNSFKDVFKDFAYIKSYFFLFFYSLGTASFKEHVATSASRSRIGIK